MNESMLCAISRTPRGKERRRIRAAVAAGSWLAFLFVLAAWALLHAGDEWGPATLLLFGPRWLLLVPLLPLILSAVCWRRRSLGPLLLALVLVLGPVMGFNVPWRLAPAKPVPGMRLRVLTCNVHHRQPNEAALAALLDDSRPDVVAVQELPGQASLAYFAEEQWHLHRMPGLFLASRHPIRQVVRLGDNSSKMPGLLARYELETPAGTVTLFHLHFASPREGIFTATHHPIVGMAELEDNSAVRRQQCEELARLADRVTGPVLLLGDFNTPPESVIFRRVWEHYTDAFASSGWGWGYTFIGSRTSVRIDHVLAGPGWHCSRCWVADSIGPPHRPVLADLVWKE